MIHSAVLSQVSAWPMTVDSSTGIVAYRHPTEDLVSLHPVLESSVDELLARLKLL
jgi:hypothetical protein